MLRALWTAASGMEAQQLSIDIISNNLANVNTAGFKKSRGDFQDLLYQNLREAGAASSGGAQIPTSIQIGHGTRPVSAQKIFQQGDYERTDNSLDLAIEGSGFFQIRKPNGDTAYTRAGIFSQDGEGKIVTADGFALEPEISIPKDALSVTITTDGSVSVLQSGQINPSQIGIIQIANFPNPTGLNSLGRNLYAPTATSGEAVVGTPGENGLGTIAQGFVEMSNVDVVGEMVSMIIAQRAYEINSKTIKAADDMLQMANNMSR